MGLFVALGGLLGFLAVAIGAFGAHGLRATLEAHRTTATFQTGVQYHMAHALAILLVALLLDRLREGALLRASAGLFLAGIVLFSGSLYLLSVTGARGWGAVAPLGGLCFLVGWACVLMAGLQSHGR
ncbi:MAG: DUF423 domain-containing protein [Chloroherpetonaceae bacterium]|nr:DUF423 domain-containing protein [Chthonomonadaceae bacterium]MDW8206226.1 DUF423 domain-containing protein [Chloroherpetonaceae bacterium]